MKKIIIMLFATLLLVGCGSKSETEQPVEAKLVVGKSLKGISINDQFGETHIFSPDTKKVIFALSKETGHTANDFFGTQLVTYLSDNNTQFVVDISMAPALIVDMFIAPGLKDFKHPVLVFSTKDDAAPFRKGVDTEKIIVVYLDSMKITEIKTVTTADELQAIVEAVN